MSYTAKIDNKYYKHPKNCFSCAKLESETFDESVIICMVEGETPVCFCEDCKISQVA
jgi:hypothetical protein